MCREFAREDTHEDTNLAGSCPSLRKDCLVFKLDAECELEAALDAKW